MFRRFLGYTASAVAIQERLKQGRLMVFVVGILVEQLDGQQHRFVAAKSVKKTLMKTYRKPVSQENPARTTQFSCLPRKGSIGFEEDQVPK